MGIGYLINTLTDTVKSYTPSLTSVYDYSVGTVSKVDNAVRVNVGPKLTGCLPDVESCTKIGQKLTGYLPDDENRAKIKQFAWNFGKNAVDLGVHEGAKFVPGGSFFHTAIVKSLPDQKKEELTKKVNTLQARITMLEKQAAGSGKSNNGKEIPNSDKPNFDTASCLDTTINFQKPEDVIRIFMMKEFVGREINEQIVENLMVPGVGKYGK